MLRGKIERIIGEVTDSEFHTACDKVTQTIKGKRTKQKDAIYKLTNELIRMKMEGIHK